MKYTIIEYTHTFHITKCISLKRSFSRFTDETFMGKNYRNIQDYTCKYKKRVKRKL